jgi:uncharacterized protein YggU (UPF0235/DUF167 family)
VIDAAALEVREREGGCQFAVKAVPGASADRIAGVLGAALKVQVAAPPERGKANARLCALLARVLGVPAAAVSVAAGAASPRKLVFVAGLAAAELRSRLQRAAAP